MKTPLKFIALILCAFCSVSLVAAKPAKQAAFGGKSYVYKTSVGQERKMEVFSPPNHKPSSAKAPGMILFHGGAWLGGNLNEFRSTCEYFASRGIVCATAEYQMLKMSRTKANQMPAGQTYKDVCVIDAKSAIRWFKQNAKEFGMDPDRIIAGGTSAGGHISALAAMNPGLNDPADPKNIDTSVVAFFWINPAFAPSDSRTPEIDVMHHLKAAQPPAIVFFGDKDPWKQGWDIAHKKWKSLGAKNIDLWVAPGQNHGFGNSAALNTMILIETDKFLVKHGLLTGEPTLPMPESGEKFVPAP
jgi:dienelactone hydrolase